MQPLLASLVSAGARHGLGAVALSLSLVAMDAPQAANAQGLPDFTDLVDKVGPAVVNIRTTERPRAGRGPGGAEMDEDMLEFFRRFGIPAPSRPNPRSPQPRDDGDAQPRGVGSGFILNADGYVLTNAHVVDGADEVIVTLADKREFKAKTIGADKRSDVALADQHGHGLGLVELG